MTMHVFHNPGPRIQSGVSLSFSGASSPSPASVPVNPYGTSVDPAVHETAVKGALTVGLSLQGESTQVGVQLTTGRYRWRQPRRLPSWNHRPRYKRHYNNRYKRNRYNGHRNHGYRNYGSPYRNFRRPPSYRFGFRFGRGCY